MITFEPNPFEQDFAVITYAAPEHANRDRNTMLQAKLDEFERYRRCFWYIYGNPKFQRVVRGFRERGPVPVFIIRSQRKADPTEGPIGRAIQFRTADGRSEPMDLEVEVTGPWRQCKNGVAYALEMTRIDRDGHEAQRFDVFAQRCSLQSKAGTTLAVEAHGSGLKISTDLIAIGWLAIDPVVLLTMEQAPGH